MKKLLSIILAAAMLLSLIPSVFAAGEGIQELELSDFFVRGAGTPSSSKYAPPVLSWTGIRVRRYSIGAVSTATTHAQFGAIKVNVAKAGEYNIYMKTDNPTQTSIAPAIAMGKYTDSMETATTTSALTGGKAPILGYFDFSKAPTGKYAPVTIDGTATGEKSTIVLEAGDNYILFLANSNSLELNPYVKDSSGAVQKAKDGTNSAENKDNGYRQEMYLSGIKLVPANIPFALPQKILHSGETLSLEGVPYGAVLSSSDETILTVSSEGKVTGVNIGKATVTADVNGVKQTIEIPVVGENLIEKAKAGDSYFANGIYHKTAGTTTDSSATKWTLSGFGSTEKINDILLPGATSPITGIKATYKTGAANRIQANGSTDTEENLKKYYADSEASGKIYELSTWAKFEADGEKAFPTTKVIFYGYYWNNSTTSRNPTVTLDLSGGGMDWQYISPVGVYIDKDYPMYFNPRLDMATSSVAGGTAYLTGMSIHEVVFDELKLSDSLVELDPEETHTLSATHLSNTGNEFHNYYYYNAEGRGKIDPTYKSENTAVATVNEKTGLITAVAPGETTVTVTSTIGEIEKSAIVKVIVASADEGADSTVSFAETTNIDGFDNIEIKSVNRGATVELTAHKKDIEGYKFIGWKRGADTSDKNAWVELSGDTYSVWTNTYLTAIYEKETASTEKAVEFWNQNGAYIGKMNEETYNAQDSLFTPSLVGFGTFLGWFTEKDVPFTAGLTLADGVTNAVAQYNASSVSNVTFDGNAIADANTYDKEIELFATTSATTCWKRDGEIIAYGDSYKFNVWDATNITEGTEEISDKVPVAVLDYSEKHNAYMLEYDAGDYEIVEAGIIFGKDTPAMKRFTSQRKVSHNQFTVPEEDGLNATGYIVYTLDKGASYKFKYVTVSTAE